MIIQRALSDPGYFVALVTTLIIGLTFHEFAHAWTANRLGDSLAASQGRLTLDPRKHIDPMGALVFLMVGFGWAKPVPIDAWRLDRNEVLLVAMAGPVSNILLASVSGVLLRVLFDVGGVPIAVLSFLVAFTYLNLVLACFNMIPVPPLDGWKVLLGLVPAEWSFRLRELEPRASILLLVLIFAPGFLRLPFNPIWDVINPAIRVLWWLLVGPELQAPNAAA